MRIPLVIGDVGFRHSWTGRGSRSRRRRSPRRRHRGAPRSDASIRHGSRRPGVDRASATSGRDGSRPVEAPARHLLVVPSDPGPTARRWTVDRLRMYDDHRSRHRRGPGPRRLRGRSSVQPDRAASARGTRAARRRLGPRARSDEHGSVRGGSHRRRAGRPERRRGDRLRGSRLRRVASSGGGSIGSDALRTPLRALGADPADDRGWRRSDGVEARAGVVVDPVEPEARIGFG